ncbi:MAG TPA: phosphoenolpyruvate carboxykinase (GTP) [Elusimicrobia bacterium]|nr:MAG: phosphoenolpyruvate carboxykinase [Elusimicrobia bacterium GWA2_66_18]HAZ07572.1 phosphoenolpyruvate carboxykinase (GTP) [Elusimicrobiota bacterium]
MVNCQHAGLKAWVDEMAALCQPDGVIWVDGSEAEKKVLENRAVARGFLIPLDQERYPGCFYSRSNPNDVARTEHLTYICAQSPEDAGPTNNWMSPEDGYAKAATIFQGSMKGRNMYVVAFSMGPVGSPFSKIGVELTDSVYVVLNMRIMTRVGRKVLDRLGTDGEFTKCLHSKADLDVKHRLVLHFPQDNTIWSVGSAYGGNALLGKKCLALRIASWQARKENWLAEHMLILGVEHPGGQVEYVTAAFPSACGKTNLAMLIPPEGLKAKGYRIWTVGDDIAWLRVGADGRLWACNPEAGFFGVAPGTNSKTNPNAMAAMRKNTIFTNVLLGDDLSVWWEDGDGAPPALGTSWEAKVWKPGMKDENGKPVLAAHPNSRFTAPAGQCPTISPNWENPEGVPISAMIFGGRRERLAPLVFESFDWNHGVYVGATVASERTAAAMGAVGEVRRDPMAMIPFCGYNMGDYFGHWLDMGAKIPRPPKIFHVNWFRKDESGKFLWPGYGENLRVLEWILARSRGEGRARKTPIGWLPAKDALDLTGLDLPAGTMDKLLEVKNDEWTRELDGVKAFFLQFGSRMPQEMWRQFESLKERLKTAVAA